MVNVPSISQSLGKPFPPCGKLVPSQWEARSLPVGTSFPSTGNFIPRPGEGNRGALPYSLLMLSTGFSLAIRHDWPSTMATMTASNTMPISTYMGQPTGTWVEKADSHRWLT